MGCIFQNSEHLRSKNFAAFLNTVDRFITISHVAVAFIIKVIAELANHFIWTQQILVTEKKCGPLYTVLRILREGRTVDGVVSLRKGPRISSQTQENCKLQIAEQLVVVVVMVVVVAPASFQCAGLASAISLFDPETSVASGFTRGRKMRLRCRC